MRQNQYHTDRWLLLAGFVWITMGTVAFTSPSATYWVIVKYSGVALFLDGLLLLFLSFRDEKSSVRNWRLAESVIDLTFCTLLLLDPIFALFAFPFIVTPWMSLKGLIKMLGSAVNAGRIRRWRGDFIGGLLLLCFGLFIPHDPMERNYGVTLLIGTLGWTLGLVYCYDFFREKQERPGVKKDQYPVS